MQPPDDPYPTVECPGIFPIDHSPDDGVDDEIPPGDPPPLDNDDREHAEHLIETDLWARFDRACYTTYWQHQAAS